ncbi:MAG: ribonuclease HI [Candidatus Improbicoccus pseudotrichonymphae]|uniref:Ribonuclease H n=1 Tax=Candidatus Improbicoccus pseudotrichonymphae TaxID=3033792 RepID=A0AA48I4Z8_9FIRM|nr:MAG: ribonuclease HI [Candidatus Improbicoccus pseudotrichonymphae]
MIVLKKVKIFSDGACSGNPGPGGWAAILRYNGHEKKISGFEKMTTNNRMELSAIINALKILKEPCEVEVYSDSKYIINAIEKKWLFKWSKNNWKKSNNKEVINIELWKEILNLINLHKISLIWIKGHSGNPENEECDRMATEAYKSH